MWIIDNFLIESKCDSKLLSGLHCRFLLVVKKVKTEFSSFLQRLTEYVCVLSVCPKVCV